MENREMKKNIIAKLLAALGPSRQASAYYRNGKPVTNAWVTADDGKRYYFDENGVMVTGTFHTGEKIHYFGDDGVYSHSISLNKMMIALTYP